MNLLELYGDVTAAPVKVIGKILVDVLILAAIIGAIVAGWIWFLHRHDAPVGVPQVATVAPAVAEVTTEPVQSAPVIVYRAPAKAKLKLPDAVQSNVNQHVLASSTIAADDHPHTLTTVLDTATGQATTYDTLEPLPWLAIDTHGEAGMYYGLKDGHAAIRAEIRQNLLQIKAVHVQGIASVDQYLSGPISADYFAGIGLAYRW